MSAKKSTLAAATVAACLSKKCFQVARFVRRAHSMVSDTEMLKSHGSGLEERE